LSFLGAFARAPIDARAANPLRIVPGADSMTSTPKGLKPDASRSLPAIYSGGITDVASEREPDSSIDHTAIEWRPRIDSPASVDGLRRRCSSEVAMSGTTNSYAPTSIGMLCSTPDTQHAHTHRTQNAGHPPSGVPSLVSSAQASGTISDVIPLASNVRIANMARHSAPRISDDSTMPTWLICRSCVP
jgi:hypothetical protein